MSTLLSPAEIVRRWPQLTRSRIAALVREDRLKPSEEFKSAAGRVILRLFSIESIQHYLETRDPRGRRRLDDTDGGSRPAS